MRTFDQLIDIIAQGEELELSKGGQSAAFAVSRMTQIHRLNKRLGRYAELVVQISDHGKREPALEVEDFRNSGTAPQQRL